MKKRKYVRKPMTNNRIIKKITSIRTKNNKQWMAILALAFRSTPKVAAAIMGHITENDRLVTKWMSRLGKK